MHFYHEKYLLKESLLLYYTSLLYLIVSLRFFSPSPMFIISSAKPNTNLDSFWFILRLINESGIDLNYIHFSFIDERRWNISLKNGVKILLPETKVLDTLRLLKKIALNYNVLNGNFAEIDLRIYGKYFLKPKIN